MNPKLNKIFQNAKKWREEANALRPILCDAGLDEELKWGKACYTAGGKNIAIVQRMNAFLALMFFKGALLDDPKGLLKRQGPNSNAARRLEFTSVEDVNKAKGPIKRFVRQALALEKAGVAVAKPTPAPLAKELLARFKKDPALHTAFKALTPGRQRYYNIHFSEPARAETRERRIDACTPRILAGKGFRDR